MKARRSRPIGGEFVERLPEYIAVDIGLDKQFMPGARHIHEAAVRCLAAELRLGFAADDALLGRLYDEQGAVETAGKTRRANAVDRIERRV